MSSIQTSQISTHQADFSACLPARIIVITDSLSKLRLF
jgi:hypothetical protein